MKRKAYITLSIISIILIFTNPTHQDLKDYGFPEGRPDKKYYLLFFSIYNTYNAREKTIYIIKNHYMGGYPRFIYYNNTYIGIMKNIIPIKSSIDDSIDSPDKWEQTSEIYYP